MSTEKEKQDGQDAKPSKPPPLDKRTRAGNGKWPKKEDMRQIVFNKAGIVQQVADAIEVDRRSVQRRCADDAEFYGWFVEARERNLDMSEAVIFDAINKKNLTATIFHLKCHAKHRGWVERHEVVGPDGRGAFAGLDDPRKIADGIRDALMDPEIRRQIAEIRESIDARTIAAMKANGGEAPRPEDAVTKH